MNQLSANISDFGIAIQIIPHLSQRRLLWLVPIVSLVAFVLFVSQGLGWIARLGAEVVSSRRRKQLRTQRMPEIEARNLYPLW